MKEYIVVKPTAKDPETGMVDEIEIDSQWSQEKEMLCERIVKQIQNLGKYIHTSVQIKIGVHVIAHTLK